MGTMINQQIQSWKILVDDLRRAADERRVTQEMIAERTGLLQSNISRIFCKKYVPKLETILIIASAIGVKLTIEEIEP